ncbi:reverse transcriptase family protein [Streptococcus dysgalactiae subsp. equisimilis]|nr:reverse transcriptase family protein [Streptococcus dysgalactiae subsp. equisimilis]
MKAEVLAKHYSTVYAVSTSPSPTLETLAPGFYPNAFEVQDVNEELCRLKTQKAPGPDGLHPLVLKELTVVLAFPFTTLFNASLESGKLPREWKKAVICPMYKGGSKKDPSSYRPVSLTCITGKIIERLISVRLRSHLESYRLFGSSQHGFRKNRCCLSNLLMARESWASAKAAGRSTDVVFVDFSKAFDKVPHDRLLEKLRVFGVQDKLLHWMEDFLVGRTFSVRVAQRMSRWREATSGVPQGSVLGPLLFLIYINDLPKLFESPCLVYADDLKLWRVIHSAADREALQEDLEKLFGWATTWALPVNTSKCVYMHLRARGWEYIV